MHVWQDYAGFRFTLFMIYVTKTEKPMHNQKIEGLGFLGYYHIAGDNQGVSMKGEKDLSASNTQIFGLILSLLLLLSAKQNWNDIMNTNNVPICVEHTKPKQS